MLPQQEKHRMVERPSSPRHGVPGALFRYATSWVLRVLGRAPPYQALAKAGLYIKYMQRYSGMAENL